MGRFLFRNPGRLLMSFPLVIFTNVKKKKKVNGWGKTYRFATSSTIISKILWCSLTDARLQLRMKMSNKFKISNKQSQEIFFWHYQEFTRSELYCSHYQEFKRSEQDWELTVAQIMNPLLRNSDLNWRKWRKGIGHSGMT